MAVTQQEIDDAHTKGQKDGYEGRYDPPRQWYHGSLAPYTADLQTLDEAYDAGYENGRRQRFA